ncbi:DNA topoisomerase III [Oxalobacter aliiformigenes]|uniref:DNA topoisomerase III n=1 Tax=Oxalobacter aliiformigenes TaxID=2946593 RepID=UPI0022AEB5C9|nr:DNA topoisomerase III [Oxalobacter aliiformigenes]WAV93738.1 DNA topoisomerase III [Oxalobacter aliiformigenes]WAV94759.1 DNA topoisomerase III [Oxalobacter aliiformigenes]
MTKTLIIAEKPSVANDIAKSLGGFTKEGDYFESEQYVLTSAVGHLLEIKAPEEYEVKRGKWSFANLPVIPPDFALEPIAKTESRLKLLNKLIRRKDISTIVNACDAGREGELIFRLIAQYTKAKQPIKRLWLQSMTPAAIRDGFKHLRDDEEMLPLARAARSRSEADWLIGINGTRAMTAFNSKEGGFFLTTVGRVQTPTLSIVVQREEKIKNFVPRDYWEVRAEFVCAGGVYEGKWLDADFKKDEADPEKRAERLWSRAAADAIVAACLGKNGTVTEESKPTTSISPALFDLTSLQREANARFGFSAKNTLALAQVLYERHKVLTYPRTDSRHLPEDYLQTSMQTLECLTGNAGYESYASQILQNRWVRPNKRIFDNKKISDHFAIIPTTQLPKNLSEPEQKLYDLVTRRFMAVFFPAAEFLVTTRFTEVAGHRFKSEGRVMTKPGWLAVYGREIPASGKNSDNDRLLVPVSPGEAVLADKVLADELVTKPPARYTEATLLSAMEGAGKLVEDELREAMMGKGLGTPATRAAIIEGLLAEKYLLREGRELIPTPKAFQLMTLLKGLGVKELTLPELTGEWEFKLAQMEKGQISREEFMQQIAQMAQIIVKRAKEYDEDTIPGDYATLKTPCPKCGGEIRENYRRFACTKCDFSISKTPGSRQFSVPEVEELLENGQIGPLQGFRSKMGRPFAAILKIVPDAEKDNFKLEFDFGQPQAEDAEALDLSGKTPVGSCPKCHGQVYEAGLSYLCENSVAKPKTCDFRSGRIILQQEIAPEQMAKLLKEGQTDLLPGFVSQRTHRPFKAYLALGKDGKVSFKFEETSAKASAAVKKKASSSARTKAAGDNKTATPRKTAARKTTVRKTAVTKEKKEE